jgi:8-oxo-dGTP diphosphatase
MIQFGKSDPAVTYVERLSAYGVVPSDSGAVAVIKTPDGHFLPGGGAHTGETAEEALRREIIEETGYAPVILRNIGVAAQITYAEDKRVHYRKVGHFFLAQFAGKITEPVEADHDLIWCPADEAIRKMTHEYQAWAIREALRLGQLSPSSQ